MTSKCLAIASSMIVMGSASLALAGETPGLWDKYIKPIGSATAPGQVILVENVPLVQAVPGSGPNTAALACILEHAFPDGAAVDPWYMNTPDIFRSVGGLAQAKAGRPLTPAEQEDLYASVVRGDIQKANAEAFKAYYEIRTQTKQTVRKHRELRSAGQKRMALLLTIAQFAKCDDDAPCILKAFQDLRLLGASSLDISAPKFENIWAGLEHHVPGLLIQKSDGKAYVVVGAVQDGQDQYIVLADPVQVAQDIRPGRPPKQDLESQDPGVRKMAENLANEKFTYDVVFRAGPDPIRGVSIIPFDRSRFARWLIVWGWENDLGKHPHFKQTIEDETLRIKENHR